MTTLNCLVTSQVALVVKNPAAKVGDVRDAGSVPGWGRFPGGGYGNPLQYSCLVNPMDRGAWRATYSAWSPRVGDNWSDLARSMHIARVVFWGRLFCEVCPDPSFLSLTDSLLHWTAVICLYFCLFCLFHSGSFLTLRDNANYRSGHWKSI